MKLLIIILFFASYAQAQIGVDFVLVRGGVNRSQAVSMFQVARAKLAQAGVSATIRSFRIVANSGPQVDLSTWNQQFWYWAKWAWARGYRRKHPIYIMIPPFYDHGVPYLGGQSEGICSPKGYAVGNAEMVNHLGQNRFYHSATIIAHELAHLFGAKHAQDISMMNIGALGFDVTALKFNETSIRQIARCLGD